MKALLSLSFLLSLLARAHTEEILIIGGEYSSWTLQVYDPTASVNTRLVFGLINGTSREHIRLNHVGVLLENSSILIMGGRDIVTKRRLNSTALLNLGEGNAVFKAGPDMNDVRSGAAAVKLRKEVVVCGGVEGTGPRCPLNTCEVLKNGETWTQMEPMISSRGGLALAVVKDIMYAIGGESWQGNCKNRDLYTLYNTAEKYDPDTKKWTMVSPMVTKRFLHTSAVYNNKIYVCGGQDGGSTIYSDCELYDPANDKWTPAAKMARPRFGFGMAVMGDKLYALGGSAIPYSKREFHDMDTTLYAVESLSAEGGKWERSTCGLLAQTYAPSVTVISDAEYRTIKQIHAQALKSASPALTASTLLLPLLSLQYFL